MSFLFAVCLIRPYALWFCWLSDYSFVQMAKISVPGDSIWQKIVTLLLGKDEKIWNLFVNIIQIGSEADRLILTQPKTCGVYVCVSGMWWGAKNVKAKKSVCVCVYSHSSCHHYNAVEIPQLSLTLLPLLTRQILHILCSILSHTTSALPMAYFFCLCIILFFFFFSCFQRTHFKLLSVSFLGFFPPSYISFWMGQFNCISLCSLFCVNVGLIVVY